MDLSQAEAVADLIASSSAATHRLAMSQMRGGFSKELTALRDQLLHFTSLIELELDFSDHEELEFADRSELCQLANNIEKVIARLVNSFSVGNAIKNGVPVAIVGETNAGKSTLLNVLLNEEKAIVSDIHGTTRDIIEDTVNIGGITFRFIDTAGIRETSDTIESIGIERTFQKLDQAEIVLWIIDATDAQTQITQLAGQLLPRCERKQLILVYNKADLVDNIQNSIPNALALLCERKHITGDAATIIERCGNIPVYTGKRELLATLTGYTLTRGVLCAMRRPKPHSIEEICREARRIVVIDGVVDATNIGAIFRSAAALGIDAVLLTPTSCDPLNRRAVRVSMGSVFLVPWTWLDTSFSKLHDLGFRTAAMALTDHSISIDNPLLATEPKLAIIMGTEGDGLSYETIAEADYVVRIPMSHDVDSLNVAAAAAVAFWQLRAPDSNK